MTSRRPPATCRSWIGRIYLLVGIVLLGLSLRHAVTGVAPLLSTISADLGMGAMDMGALLDDVELYPDEMLADIATRLGFGTLYDQVLGVATQ